MPLSPEIKKIPGIISRFNRAGLTGKLISALIKGETGRDLIVDARKLMVEYGGNELVDIRGVDSIPQGSGCLVVFNHPNMDVLLPAMLTLMVKVHDQGGHIPTILMGAEIPLFGKFNQTYPLPGSIGFIRRFHQLYSENIISVPISTTRKDYHLGRFLAVRKTVAALRNGNIVLVAPEGHVEMNNTISPVDTLHSGSGALSIMASRVGVPTVPIGIWEAQRGGLIRVDVGMPFMADTNDNDKAVCELMSRVARIMPENLRGPFG